MEAISGPGKYSLDVALGIALPEPASFLIGLLLVLIGIAVALVTRAPAVSETTTPGGATPAESVQN